MEPANKAKFSVDLTKRQMEQLDAKIAQQRKQIAEFQRMDNAALLLKDPPAFQKMQEMRTRLSARLCYVANCKAWRVRWLSASRSSSRIVKWFAFAIGIGSPGR